MLRDHKVIKAAVQDKESELQVACVAYAKQSCRSLCHDIYSKFPREIRDMIYSYIHLPEDVQVTSEYFINENESKIRMPYLPHLPEHVWGTDYLGEKVQLELCEQFYCATTFHFPASELEVLPLFRVEDPWKLSQPPAFFVTNLSLDIHCREWYLGKEDIKAERHVCEPCNWCRDTPRWGITPEPPPPTKKEKEKAMDRVKEKAKQKLLLDLELLFGFRRGTKITLRISSGRRYEEEVQNEHDWMLDNVLPAILPTLHRFKEFGYSVHVILHRVGSMMGFQDLGCEDFLVPDSWKESLKQVSTGSWFLILNQANLNSSGPKNWNKKRY